MKKRIYQTFLFVFLIYISLHCYSQNERKLAELKRLSMPRNVLKTNPFNIIQGSILYTSEYRMVYETAITQKQSIQFGVSLFGKNSMLRNLEERDSVYSKYNVTFKVSGYRVQGSVKFYLSPQAPSGFYLAPHLSYSTAKFTNNFSGNDSYTKAIYINYNLLLGQQVILGRFCFDYFFGIGYKNNQVYDRFNGTTYAQNDEEERTWYIIGEPIKFYLGINFGYAF